MSPRTKFFVLLAVGSFAAMIALSIVGTALQERHVLDDPALAKRAGYAAGAIFFALFLVMGFAIVPLFLRAFLVLQTRIGNGELGLVKGLRAHERGVTWAVWGFFLLGLGIAAPVMLRDVLGTTESVGPSEGLLVARIGMTLDEVRQRSSIRLLDGTVSQPLGYRTVIGSPVFDFQIADSGIRFERCRYYWMQTGNHGDPHIESINVGVSPTKMTRAELALAHRRVQQQLVADGWQAGAYRFKTPEQRALHGGATSSGEGYFWKKDGTLLELEGKRMDDEQPGEDPETAGAWIQYVQLSSPADSAWSDLDFAPPAR